MSAGQSRFRASAVASCMASICLFDDHLWAMADSSLFSHVDLHLGVYMRTGVVELTSTVTGVLVLHGIPRTCLLLR